MLNEGATVLGHYAWQKGSSRFGSSTLRLRVVTLEKVFWHQWDYAGFEWHCCGFIIWRWGSLVPPFCLKVFIIRLKHEGLKNLISFSSLWTDFVGTLIGQAPRAEMHVGDSMLERCRMNARAGQISRLNEFWLATPPCSICIFAFITMNCRIPVVNWRFPMNDRQIYLAETS